MEKIPPGGCQRLGQLVRRDGSGSQEHIRLYPEGDCLPLPQKCLRLPDRCGPGILQGFSRTGSDAGPGGPVADAEKYNAARFPGGDGVFPLRLDLFPEQIRLLSERFRRVCLSTGRKQKYEQSQRGGCQACCDHL